MDFDANTVVDNLMNGISAETKEDLLVTDEVLFSKMISDGDPQDDTDESIRWDGFCWDLKWDRLFPISRAVLCFIWSCFMGLVFAIYSAFEWIAFRLTGKRKNLRRSIRTNSVILIGGMIATITMIVVMLVFFIKDVLLFPADNHINDFGTVTMAQPCGVEHNVLLVNSCEFWAETGIRVVKGDVVKIAASGAFYGNLVDFHDSALKNRERSYAPDNFHWKKDDAPGFIQKLKQRICKTGAPSEETQFCVYGRNQESDARYGSLLYQIKSEGQTSSVQNPKDKEQVIFQVNPLKDRAFEFKAKKSGVLCFAINDIYLDDPEFINEIIDYDLRRYAEYKKDSTKPRPLLSESTLSRIDGNPAERKIFITSILEGRKSKTNPLPANKSMWYDDNIGEILLNVNIERKNPGNLFSFLTKPFRWIFHNHGWRWILGILCLLLTADTFIGAGVRRKRQ
ncbi:MAG: hypothetical protein IKV05_01330 [Bacteroidales bacterium]|nr:hypothetical protein [Bacteroidales bacterium]